MTETFKRMVNDCLSLGLANNISTMKRLSKLCYPQLARYDIYSKYKLHAISKAAGMLATRKKSLRRDHSINGPYMRNPCLVSSYESKILDGSLMVPLGDREYIDIPLNNYVKGILSDPTLKVRSFTLVTDLLSICVSKEVVEIECTKTIGVDRNLENLTAGDDEQVMRYDLAKL